MPSMPESPYKVQPEKVLINIRSTNLGSGFVKGLLVLIALVFSFEFIAKLLTDADAPSLLFATKAAFANNATTTTTLNYFDLKDDIKKRATSPTRHGRTRRDSTSAYNEATVTHHAPWFNKRKKCRASAGCCVETAAISLEQDDHKIINTGDGKDIADLMLEQVRRPDHHYLNYHASSVHEQMLPCLVPGTILFLENIPKSITHFWNTLRPKITVPYALILSGSDRSTPDWTSQQYLSDPLLIKLFGTNPNMTNSETQAHNNNSKYEAIPTGLSRAFPQEKYLSEYLELTNFQNPFEDKERWDLSKDPLDFDQDVFVHFGLRRPHRRDLWNVLCPNTSYGHNNKLSCHQETSKLKVHDIYSSMSQHYRFGVSPTGHGWDCYRTYELLLLGIIPIVDDRRQLGSKELFEGLPVIQMSMFDNNLKPTSKQDFVEAIQDYIASDDFQKNDFQDGWQKLFLKYTRRRLLEATGRNEEILRDDNGKEYYQAYKYTLTKQHHDHVFCGDKGSCVVPGDKVDDSWFLKTPKLTTKDKDFHSFMKHWKDKMKATTEN